jgi:hypothetical protein
MMGSCAVLSAAAQVNIDSIKSFMRSEHSMQAAAAVLAAHADANLRFGVGVFAEGSSLVWTRQYRTASPLNHAAHIPSS